MPGFDTDPEVLGAQKEGEAFSGSPLVAGAKDESSLVRALKVDASGRLLVIQASVVPPQGATTFQFAIPQANLSFSSTDVRDSPAIPSGKTLYLQIATGGSELDGFGNRVDVIWLTGAGPTEHLIEQYVIHGPSVTYALFDTSQAQDGTPLVGDGTNTKIRVRRSRYSGGSLELPFSIRGYTQ